MNYYETVVDTETFTKPYLNTLSTGKKVPTCFITVKEVCELTGLSLPTVRRLFKRKDFPANRLSRPMSVEIHAFMRYFSIARESLD